MVQASIKAFKITKASIDRLALEDDGQHRLYDEELPGFGILIGKRAKTYFAERSVRGKKLVRRVTIGRHGLITAEQARQEARELLSKMAKGIDPVAERKAQERQAEEAKRRIEQDNITLSQLWEEFTIDRKGKLALREIR